MTHLDKRKLEYEKIQKHKELYGSKLVYLPKNLIIFLQDHKEVNFSAFVTKQVYRLKEQVEKQEYLDKHQDLIQEAKCKVTNWRKQDRNHDAKVKQVNSLVKHYFEAKFKGNSEVAEQSKQLLKKLSPEVFSYFPALEEYFRKHPNFMKRAIPWEKMTK